jgi:effector-binding domain-containing protein
MSDYQIREVPRQETAVLSLHCNVNDISSVMGEAFAKVFEAVTRSGSVPAGPVFSRYFAFSEETVDFEAGIAVTEPFTGDGDVKASTIGDCEAAVTMHTGPYDSLSKTYEALQAWIGAQGRKPGATMWEVYLTDPEQEPDPSKWQTEVYWPVE